MPEVILAPHNDNLNFLLHNDKSRYFPPHEWEDEEIRERWDGRGWNFSSGDPEFWKFKDRLLAPGGRLLDIGMGNGGSSIFFALNCMEVVGVETNSDRVHQVNLMAAELSTVIPDFKMQAIKADATSSEFPEGPFDTVSVDYLNHLPSQEDAYAIFGKALGLLKSGGHIWARGAGKHSDQYADQVAESMRGSFGLGHSEVWMENENVIWSPCDCSGQLIPEPTVYFDPFDFVHYFGQAGCRLVHSQTIEGDGRMNIMYGEDFLPGVDYTRGGMITMLAQKLDRPIQATEISILE